MSASTRSVNITMFRIENCDCDILEELFPCHECRHHTLRDLLSLHCEGSWKNASQSLCELIAGPDYKCHSETAATDIGNNGMDILYLCRCLCLSFRIPQAFLLLKIFSLNWAFCRVQSSTDSPDALKNWWQSQKNCVIDPALCNRQHQNRTRNCRRQQSR